ncbi:unnamed protein product, partial [Schistosoma mattheei]
TGKSVIANNYLIQLPKENYLPNILNFSARTTANQTQDIIMSRLDRRRKCVYGPPIGKQCIVFIDDLNMPMKEKYGAQPPIELLRMWIDHNHWYDRKDNTKQYLVDVTSTSEGKHGIQWTAQNQLDDLDSADGQALLSHTHQQMQIKTAGVAAVSASVGLNTHKGKTKVLKYNTETTNPITLDGETLEDVESFTYLRSIINEQGGSHADVKARIGKQFMAAMGPPGGGRNNITPRLTRHTNVLGVNEFDDQTMLKIFTTITDAHFSNGFEPQFMRLSKILVQATLHVYKLSISTFLPTPAKSHYIFNLRDFARVIKGIRLIPSSNMKEEDKLMRLWIHEVK